TDSPFHFDDTGATSDFLDLNRFIGPARVISLTDRMRIRREELELFDLSSTPRVLFRTDAWKDHTRFPTQIPVMDEDVPAWLHQQGVILVGVDLPSIDPLDSKNLPNHHAIGAYGITILEGLNLADVPAGRYE